MRSSSFLSRFVEVKVVPAAFVSLLVGLYDLYHFYVHYFSANDLLESIRTLQSLEKLHLCWLDCMICITFRCIPF